MKTLKFAKNLVPLVLSGKKTTTWRVFDDKNLSVGDEIIFLKHGSNEQFAVGKIISIREKKMSEIDESDFDGHEKYESPGRMIEVYKGYYGDKVNADNLVKIIKFKLI